MTQAPDVCLAEADMLSDLTKIMALIHVEIMSYLYKEMSNPAWDGWLK